MNKNIDFYNDINLLVGINGSGKTSVLNVINWIFAPSFGNLCTTVFSSIEIEFFYNENLYVVKAIQNETNLIIELENLTSEYKFPKIDFGFEIHPKKLRNKEIQERFQNQYSFYPEKHELETWNFLYEELPKPIIIGLDRNLFTEEGNKVSYSENPFNNNKKVNIISEQSPLEKVIELSTIEYNHYKNKILELNKFLNDKIMLSSFEETLTLENINDILKSPKITIKQVEALELKVKEYFKENLSRVKFNTKITNESIKKIEGYFDNLKKFLKEVNSQSKEKFDILYITNLNQFKKIKDLIKEFEEFENKRKKSIEPIEEYLNTLNYFLKDSSKELYFDKTNSRLKFKVLDAENQCAKDDIEIDNLSSGEKQILILFTYIKFNSKFGRIFIIDEPELSLHPKWQEIFLQSIKKIMYKNTQLLFATHSPSIVGNNINYCNVLFPY